MAKKRPPDPEPPEPPLAVPPPPRHALGDATPAAFAIPAPVLAPKNDDDHINNALCLELLNPSALLAKPDDPVIEAICTVIDSIVSGSDLTPVKDYINAAMAHQPEKAAIVNRQIELYEEWTLSGLIKIAANTHIGLVKASANKELTSEQSLALHRMAVERIKDISEKMGRKQKQPSLAPDSTVTITEKLDPRGQVKEAEIAETFRHTTPHGREIIRKRLYTLKQQLYADGTLPLKSVNPS